MPCAASVHAALLLPPPAGPTLAAFPMPGHAVRAPPCRLMSEGRNSTILALEAETLVPAGVEPNA